jgi:hypothetical protein
VPTLISIVVSESPSITWARSTTPAAANDTASAFWASPHCWTLFFETRISTPPLITMRATFGFPGMLRSSPTGAASFHTQPAARSILDIWSSKPSVSSPCWTPSENGVPEKGFNFSTITAGSSIFRGTKRFSREIIVSFCAELIPSSKTKRNIVHRASIAIPPITSQNAILWTDGGYLGRSNIIPAPTAKLASTLIDNNQKWGHPGASSPESNFLKYAQIAAITGWLIVTIIAIIQLIRSITSFLEESRK